SIIRGRVVDATGQPPAAAIVSARATGNATPQLSAPTAKDGTFEIRNASPGHYVVQVRGNAPADAAGKPSDPADRRWWALEEADARRSVGRAYQPDSRRGRRRGRWPADRVGCGPGQWIVSRDGHR